VRLHGTPGSQFEDGEGHDCRAFAPLPANHRTTEAGSDEPIRKSGPSGPRRESVQQIVQMQFLEYIVRCVSTVEMEM